MISRERVNTCRVGNEKELSVGTLLITSRTHIVSQDKGIMIRRLRFKRILRLREITGALMDIQVPLLVIDRRVSTIMSVDFPNRQGGTLKAIHAAGWIRSW